MAGTTGQTPNYLTDELARNPFAFDFFRAVRLLENSRRDLPRIGRSLSPSEDPLRFCQNPSLAFAPSSLESFQQRAEDPVPKLFLRFFGLLGPNAPLPPHLTEYAFEGTGVFILGAALEQFFAKYVSLNSFTETVIRTQQRGEIMRWPAQLGRRQII